MINTSHRTVGRNRNHSNVISFAEFFFFCLGRSRHPRQFLIHTEQILVSDRSRGLRFILNWYTFFSFNCLVESIRIAATFHCPTCKLVNNQNFLFFTNHIVNVQQHNIICTKSIVNKVSQCYIFNVIQVF
ncbi:hypothetical protein D8895_10285 [Streptococcus sp. BCA20]|nr:hypothetical protein D8895_10285 [Streptococcus sp. BCA20]